MTLLKINKSLVEIDVVKSCLAGNKRLLSNDNMPRKMFTADNPH